MKKPATVLALLALALTMGGFRLSSNSAGAPTNVVVAGTAQPFAPGVVAGVTWAPSSGTVDSLNSSTNTAVWLTLPFQTITAPTVVYVGGASSDGAQSVGGGTGGVTDFGLASVTFYVDNGPGLVRNALASGAPPDIEPNSGMPAFGASINPANYNDGSHEVRAYACSKMGTCRWLSSAHAITSFTQATPGVFTCVECGYWQSESVTPTVNVGSCLTAGTIYYIGLPTAGDRSLFTLSTVNSNASNIDMSACTPQAFTLLRTGATAFGVANSNAHAWFATSDSLWINTNGQGGMVAATAYIDGVNGADTSGCGVIGSPCLSDHGALNSTLVTPSGSGLTFHTTGGFYVAASGPANGNFVVGQQILPGSTFGPLTQGLPYWVVTSNGSGVQLSQLPPGNPLGTTLTSSGTGVLNADLSGATLYHQAIPTGNAFIADDYQFPNESSVRHHSLTSWLIVDVAPGQTASQVIYNGPTAPISGTTGSPQRGYNLERLWVKNITVCGINTGNTGNNTCADRSGATSMNNANAYYYPTLSAGGTSTATNSTDAVVYGYTEYGAGNLVNGAAAGGVANWNDAYFLNDHGIGKSNFVGAGPSPGGAAGWVVNEDLLNMGGGHNGTNVVAKLTTHDLGYPITDNLTVDCNPAHYTGNAPAIAALAAACSQDSGSGLYGGHNQVPAGATLVPVLAGSISPFIETQVGFTDANGIAGQHWLTTCATGPCSTYGSPNGATFGWGSTGSWATGTASCNSNPCIATCNDPSGADLNCGSNTGLPTYISLPTGVTLSAALTDGAVIGIWQTIHDDGLYNKASGTIQTAGNNYLVYAYTDQTLNNETQWFYDQVGTQNANGQSDLAILNTTGTSGSPTSGSQPSNVFAFRPGGNWTYLKNITLGTGHGDGELEFIDGIPWTNSPVVWVFDNVTCTNLGEPGAPPTITDFNGSATTCP
jgi:hypothetical protein